MTLINAIFNIYFPHWPKVLLLVSVVLCNEPSFTLFAPKVAKVQRLDLFIVFEWQKNDDDK